MRILKCLVILLTLTTMPAFADPIHFAIIYPGGEGNAESAQPFLDNLFTVIKNNTGLELTGTYYNDIRTAKSDLRNRTIQIAIIPEHATPALSATSLKPLLKTIPIGLKKPFETYLLLTPHAETTHSKSTNTVTIFSSISFNEKKLKEIFPSIKNEKRRLEIRSFKGGLQELLSHTEDVGYNLFLLSEKDWQNILKISDSLPKLKNFHVFAKSILVPTPKVYLVNDTLSANEQEKIIRAFIDVSKTPEGKSALTNLQLKEFFP